MFELIQLTERCFYIQSPAKIGLYRLNESEVCFIDSGNDKDAGRKLRQILDKQGWKLRAIYNTHANADHIGGNRYLQAQTGCRIYAPGIDCAVTRHPILEPAFLYGAYPPKDLRHKFLLAQESDAEPLTGKVLPEGFEIIPLPGHFFDMVGFRTPDGVVFLADCLSRKGQGHGGPSFRSLPRRSDRGYRAPGAAEHRQGQRDRRAGRRPMRRAALLRGDPAAAVPRLRADDEL